MRIDFCGEATRLSHFWRVDLARLTFDRGGFEYLESFENSHPSRIDDQPQRANGSETNAEPEKRATKGHGTPPENGGFISLFDSLGQDVPKDEIIDGSGLTHARLTEGSLMVQSPYQEMPCVLVAGPISQRLSTGASGVFPLGGDINARDIPQQL